MPKIPLIRHSLLKYLSISNEMTGYDFLRYCTKNGITVSPGSVYPHLKALEKEGYIACRAMGRKKLYRLSPEGQKWVERNSRESNDTEKAIGMFQMTVSCQCGSVPVALRTSLKNFLLGLGKTNWHEEEQVRLLVELTENIRVEMIKYIQAQEGE